MLCLEELITELHHIEVLLHRYQTYSISLSQITVEFNIGLGLPIILELTISDFILVYIGPQRTDNYIWLCNSCSILAIKQATHANIRHWKPHENGSILFLKRQRSFIIAIKTIIGLFWHKSVPNSEWLCVIGLLTAYLKAWYSSSSIILVRK